MGIEVILLVVALGIVGITRGSYRKLFATKLNHWWALIPVLIGHLAIEFAPINENQFDSVGITILLGTYVFLIGFLFANINLKGMWIAFVGLCSNAIVIALNSGMPVTNSGGYRAVETIKHQPETSSDLLPFLGDMIPINAVSIAISVGDIVFAAGLLTVFYFASRKSADESAGKKSNGSESTSTDEEFNHQADMILDLTKESEKDYKPQPAPAQAAEPAPILSGSKGPGSRKTDEKRIAKVEKAAQSRKQRRWKKKHGLASLPSKEELGYDEDSMEIVDIAE